MPVEVPSQDDFMAFQEEMAINLGAIQEQVTALETRVAAIEGSKPVDPPPNGNGGGKLVAVVTMQNGGGTFSFYEANAHDAGSFHAPSGAFSMECRLLTLPDCPLRLYFRRIPGWSSIVFELGGALDATPVDLPHGYSVDIVDDHGTHHTVHIATHWALTRWRWQSGPWPHHRPVADMVAAHDIPAFDKNLALNAGPQGASYEPLSFAGFEPRMMNTGGRGEIGYVTENQGWALCTNLPEAWNAVLAQGEAMGSWSWITRDMATGAPLDVVAYPKASFYPDGSTDPLLHSSGGAWGAGIEADTAHQPAGSYVPYLRTGDPYFLEHLQFQAVFNYLEVPRSHPEMPGAGQVRGIAWSLRTLVQCWHATPDTAPSWLLPKHIWKTKLDEALTSLNGTITRDDGFRHTFHVPDYYINYSGYSPRGTCVGVWQDDFALASGAWSAVLHPPCAQFAAFMCHNALDRLAGTSGWPPGVPDVYSLQLCDADGAPPYENWTRAWEVSAPQNGYDPAHPPQQIVFTQENQFDYPNNFLGALAIAEQARAHGVALPDLSRELHALWDALHKGVQTVPHTGIYWKSAVAH